MNPEYTIRKIRDVLQIPEERFDAFCEDLKRWHALSRSVDAQLDAAVLGLNMETIDYCFQWIDDGKHDAEIVVEFQDQSHEPIP